ncbi:GNAT family N-acetyltransferase [Anaerococcus sp. NML200537]|uniref:GNAT family N-acetyltransferase n=1 Tax=Anaerococcus sp. NML200537 TaxID=2954485 RepID=UPI00223856D5|nr:GNAT family N-acetyltransferase [Anaerococcus sp. NML200537]MCW6702258.1 GNAT family N-acetyltransferase [Anaerococcus sp. NML200537]
MEKIQTKRLTLRKLNKDDAKAIYEGWASDEEVTKFLTWHPHENIETTQEILDSCLEAYKDEACYRYGIELTKEKKLIGMIDVVEFDEGIPEIGYALSRSYWNHGYMTEALKAFIYQLILRGYRKIYIEADENNLASLALIKKNGFSFLGKERKIKSTFKNELVTVNTYQLDIK